MSTPSTAPGCEPCKCAHRTRVPHCRHAHNPWPLDPPHAVTAPEPITDPLHGATLSPDWQADTRDHAARHARTLAAAADGVGLPRHVLREAALLGAATGREGRPCEAGRDEWADDEGPRDEPALARLIDAHDGPRAPIRAALIRDAYRTGWDAHARP